MAAMGHFPTHFKMISQSASKRSCFALSGLSRWTPYTCITDTIQEIANLSGYDFKVTETSCSTIAKTGFVSVYISRAHRNKPILLFKYDPAGVVPYPSITVSDMRHVTITIPIVSEVILERYEWRSVSGTVSVDYHIEHVMFPVADVSAPE